MTRYATNCKRLGRATHRAPTRSDATLAGALTLTFLLTITAGLAWSQDESADVPNATAAAGSGSTQSKDSESPDAADAGMPEPGMKVATFRPRHFSAQEFEYLLRRVLGEEVATYSKLPTQRVLIVRGAPEVLAIIDRLLAVLDTDPNADERTGGDSSRETSELPRVQSIAAMKDSTRKPTEFIGRGFPLPEGEIKIFHLQHLNVDEAYRAIAPHFPPPEMTSDPINRPELVNVDSQNVLIARGEPVALNRVEALIRTLDVPGAEKTGEAAESDEPANIIEISIRVNNARSGVVALEMDKLKFRRGVGWFDSSVLPSLKGEPPTYTLRGPAKTVETAAQRIREIDSDSEEISRRTIKPLVMRGIAESDELQGSLQPSTDPQSVVEKPQDYAADESVGEEAVDDARQLPQNYLQRRFELQHLSPWNLIHVLEGVRKRPGAEWFEMDFNVDQNWIRIRASESTMQAIEDLIVALDTKFAGSAFQRRGKSAETPEVSQDAIDELRSTFADHDARARRHAEPLRRRIQTKLHVRRVTSDDEQALRQSVAEAFEARQKLQRAELDALAAKVDSLRRMLQAREQIKDEIIQRRVEELLNPALEWETSKAGKPAAGATGDAATVKHDWPVPYTITAPSKEDATSPKTSAPERLYQGRTKSDWQRLFEAETDPASKLEAAVALLNLASPLPPEERIERILDLGEAIVRTGYGQSALTAAVQRADPSANGAYLWTLSGSGVNLSAAHNMMTVELHRIIETIDGRMLAKELSSAIVDGSDARAAFAYALLNGPAQTKIGKSEAATRIVLEDLDTPLTGIDRSALCLLKRIRLSNSATSEERTDLTGQLEQLIPMLIERQPDADTFGNAIVGWLTYVDGVTGKFPAWSVEDPRIARAMARLILHEIVDHGGREFLGSPFVVNRSTSAYDQRVLDEQRRHYGPALAGWPSVANSYFEKHDSAQYSTAEARVFNGLCQSIAFYSDGDDWPVDRTAEILTEQLRAAYTDDPQQTVAQPVLELLPASPATMLAQIVAITGEIPDFVKTGSPRSAEVVRKLAVLDQVLTGRESPEGIELGFGQMAGIAQDAPCEFIRHVIENAEAIEFPGDVTRVRLGANMHSTVAGTLQSIGERGDRDQRFIDPLLILAMLSDLAGTNEQTDVRIASVPNAIMLGATFADHIRNLLASRLQSRRHAKRMLREMAGKTESQPLLDMIKSIDPEAVKPQ